jgi:hypothetical protein
VTPTIIIDADPIVYASGFAAQSSTYEYVLEVDGVMEQHIWSDGREALAYIREKKAVVLDKQVHVDVKDPSFARQCAKTTLQGMIRACTEDLGVEDPAVELYLSGPGNFRYKVATIAPYKGDRPPPPVHYQTVRDYLTQRWAAVVVSGMEADDRVSIRCRQLAADGTPFVLATIDKDLDQVPGRHYGYKSHVFYDVNAADARRAFWVQVIAGDNTDNIPGCYRIGVGKAAKWIDSEEWYNDEELWSAIVQLYAKTMNRYPERYPKGMLSEDAALETARLVFMQEYEGQLWNPPGVAHGELSSL